MRKELRVLLVSVCFVALFTSNYSHGYAVNISEYNFADETDLSQTGEMLKVFFPVFICSKCGGTFFP